MHLFTNLPFDHHHRDQQLTVGGSTSPHRCNRRNTNSGTRKSCKKRFSNPDSFNHSSFSTAYAPSTHSTRASFNELQTHATPPSQSCDHTLKRGEVDTPPRHHIPRGDLRCSWQHMSKAPLQSNRRRRVPCFVSAGEPQVELCGGEGNSQVKSLLRIECHKNRFSNLANRLLSVRGTHPRSSKAT